MIMKFILYDRSQNGIARHLPTLKKTYDCIVDGIDRIRAKKLRYALHKGALDQAFTMIDDHPRLRKHIIEIACDVTSTGSRYALYTIMRAIKENMDFLTHSAKKPLVLLQPRGIGKQ